MIGLALLLAAADPLAPLPEPLPTKAVRRGETVTLRIARGPLTISTAARALADARPGERVRLVITATRRTVDAVAEGPGLASLPSN